jgi:hypothetical protein
MPAILSVEEQSLRSQALMLGRWATLVKLGMAGVVGRFANGKLAPSGTLSEQHDTRPRGEVVKRKVGAVVFLLVASITVWAFQSEGRLHDGEIRAFLDESHGQRGI